MMDDNTWQDIEQNIEEDKYAEAREILIKYLTIEPNNHWILTRISSTYYEEFNYMKALEFAQKAYKVSPNCPLVLWDLAGALDMVNKEKEAIDIWSSLINKGELALAFEECGEGLRSARAFINDSRYRIGLSYKDLEENNKAKKYIKIHLENRQRGQFSRYSLKEVREAYESIRIASIS
jgi:hypothetical protein